MHVCTELGNQRTKSTNQKIYVLFTVRPLETYGKLRIGYSSLLSVFRRVPCLSPIETPVKRLNNRFNEKNFYVLFTVRPLETYGKLRISSGEPTFHTRRWLDLDTAAYFQFFCRVPCLSPIETPVKRLNNRFNESPTQGGNSLRHRVVWRDILLLEYTPRLMRFSNMKTVRLMLMF